MNKSLHRSVPLRTLIVLLALWLAVLDMPKAVHGAPQAEILRSALESNQGLSGVPAWTADGEVNGGEYAYTVSAAGDVNGDGYDDVLVGAPKTGSEREGWVYLYRGSPQGAQEGPAWSASGSLNGERFGHALAGVGDVNHDGYDDVLVGAPRYNNGQPEEGALYLYFGSQDGPGASAGWMAESDLKDAQLGYALSSAGDVNHDGYPDFAAGAPGYNNGQTGEGAVFVYYGGADRPSQSPAWSYQSNLPSAYLGRAVAAADVNGDGYPDLLAGAPFYERGEDNEGALYLFRGSASGFGFEPHQIIESGQAEAHFGSALAAADFNCDGFDDVAVSAPQYDGAFVDEGVVFVFAGTSQGLRSVPMWVAASGQSYSQYGYAIASAGDTDGNGCAELLIGAYNYTNDQLLEGVVLLYPGTPAGLGSQPSWKAYGNKADASFGFSLGAAGDVNKDGYLDVLVGAPYYRLDRDLLGRAYLFLGSTAGVSRDYQLYLPSVALSP